MRHVDEKSACGVGFVAATDGRPRRALLDQGLGALCAVEHRGGNLADRATGDGAGIMAEIPFDLLGVTPGEVAVGTWFVYGDADRRRRVREVFEQTLEGASLRVADYRVVPTDTSALGRQAREALPTIQQILIERPSFCRTEASFGRLLYLTQQRFRTHLARADLADAAFFPSLSSRTIVYKALTSAHALPAFYPDLRDRRYVTRFALFHRRFSTNTTTSWHRAQPFRVIAHNGEINTIASNRAWSYAREQALGLPPNELLTHEGISDSGSLNEMTEALRWRSSIPHLAEILAIMVPPAAAESNFYRFWSRAVEPWDGPAFLAYSDGDVVGARLDRNGFRPGRWCRTPKAFYLASEAGVFELDEEQVIAKGALTGGGTVNVELSTGEVRFTDPSVFRENFAAAFDPRMEKIGVADVPALPTPLIENLPLFGYTKEEVDEVLVPMTASGKEPIGSMGDTARPAILSDEPRPFFDYFYQSFAQVTNPPLDHLRERLVTDLWTDLGRRPNVFEPKTLIPPVPGLEATSPVLLPEELEYVKAAGAHSDHELAFESVEIPMTFARVRGPEGLREALDDLGQKVLAAIDGGCSIIVLSDRLAKFERPPIPSLLALRAADWALTDAGRRLDASIVLDTGDVRSTHQLSALLSFGAAAVCPYLAFEVATGYAHKSLDALSSEDKKRRLKTAFEEGLLKIMSKMGIATVRGYQNSKLFFPLGLSQALLDRYFTGFDSVIGGLELEDIAAQILERTELFSPDSNVELIDTYQLREHRKGQKGERHSMTAGLTKRVHEFVEDTDHDFDRWASYEAYLQEAKAAHPVSLRHLLRFRKSTAPIQMDDVQPRGEILRRFGSGSMSFGAISAESQRDIIHAMREVGGRSGSGEGGENPFYYEDGTTASIKQIASGRFGVTAEYLVAGDEFEIKIAQGAKPGEGGQLMGVKVDAAIAKARHSNPGVDLISPPPLHDIYSIEDLRQLIFELKQLKPGVRVCVKLVAGTNIGTIAAGVVKAGADVVHVSGGDGGTGAASLSSMKHAGLPWELGLSEVHRVLTEQGLREHVMLRVDGGLASGFDIVAAALLGAEEFSFGKLLLVAEGCIMARVCQKNTCPRGIATQDPKFKKKYRGTKEQVVALLHYLAEDVRRHLAELGVERLDQIVGRADLLELEPAHADRIASRHLQLSELLRPVPHPRGYMGPILEERTGRLNERIVEDTRAALDEGRAVELRYPVRSTDRALLATVSGEIAKRMQARRRGGRIDAEPAEGLIRLRLTGSAGQGFAAFMTPGLDVTLQGEANDSVGKSMSGGRLVVQPMPDVTFAPEENAIIGNCAFYGATGGTAFIHGLAGDRFCVRNSGATAVVEGTGLHACEYMTQGLVVILGRAAPNVGAGMTGGTLFIAKDQAHQVNSQYLSLVAPEQDDEETVRALLEAYARATQSRTAFALLADERGVRERLLKGVPRGSHLRVVASATASARVS